VEVYSIVISGWLLFGIFLAYLLLPTELTFSSLFPIGFIVMIFLVPANNLASVFLELFFPTNYYLGLIIWIILLLLIFLIPFYQLRRK